MPIGGVRAGYLSGVKDVISDSVISRYDPSQISDSDGTSISGETDQISSRNLNAFGNPVIKTNVSDFNGENVIRLQDSSTTYLKNTDTYVSAGTKFAIVFAYRILESVGSSNHLFDGGSDLEFSIQDDSGGAFDAHRGGTNNVDLGYSPDGNVHIGVAEAPVGGDINLRIDGQDQTLATTNDSGLSGIRFGIRGNELIGIDIDFGERLVLKDYTDSDITDEESRLGDKYGITI